MTKVHVTGVYGLIGGLIANRLHGQPGPPVVDADNLAEIPYTQGEPEPCPSE